MDRQNFSAVIASAVLACNSALAVYNSWGDATSVAFVLVADAALRELERTARGGAPCRGRIKGAVWTLSTLLAAMFAARVAPLMPPVVAAVVWLMAISTAVGGVWAFFLN